MDTNQRPYDVAVIGGGAAGLSATLVLSRARRSVLVVDTGQPRNAPATHMHGYLSRDGLPPGDLLVRGREEVTSYGGNILEGRVTELVPDGRTGFWALLEGGHRIAARRVIVTTGLRDEIPIFPACVSGGPATCCTARTATGTRFATVSSASSAAAHLPFGTPRSSDSGPTTWFTSPRLTCSPRPSAPGLSPAPSASSIPASKSSPPPAPGPRPPSQSTPTLSRTTSTSSSATSRNAY